MVGAPRSVPGRDLPEPTIDGPIIQPLADPTES